MSGAEQTHPPQQRDLVVIGASAGGVDALQEVVRQFAPEFPAVVLVVLHVSASGTSVLPQILARRGALPAAFARDGDELLRGQIYVAPADHHMLVRDGRIRLSQGPRENGHRPAIDPLFRSAARDAGDRCIGVVLSGLLDDGASGLRFIKMQGGATVVQDPEDALFPSMPLAAMALTSVDRVAKASAIADALCELIEEPVEVARAPDPSDTPAASNRALRGADRVELDDPWDPRSLLVGPPSPLTCPECGGALWEQENGRELRFACHVGHVYSVASLSEEQGRALETTLWSAVRALEERADMHRRLARRASASRGASYEERAREAKDHARALREILGKAGRIAAPAGDG
jgi:two-component system chemotaxis response regulator CheB